MSDHEITGRIPAALPLWRREQWCHEDCYRRWSDLDGGVQALLGGHVHFDGESWRVPETLPPLMLDHLGVGFDLTLKLIGDSDE